MKKELVGLVKKNKDVIVVAGAIGAVLGHKIGYFRATWASVSLMTRKEKEELLISSFFYISPIHQRLIYLCARIFICRRQFRLFINGVYYAPIVILKQIEVYTYQAHWI